MFTPARKRILLLFASVLALLLPASALAAEGVVTAGTIVLRAEPDLSARKLFTVYKGSQLDVHAQSGEWYHATYGKYTGYVMKKYVSVSGSIERDSTLRPGSSGSAVRDLQQQLKQLGYYQGVADGKYGSGTERAVRSFQSAAGLSVDGRAGEKTLAALKKQASVPESSRPAGSAALRPGSSGSGVRDLQQLLKKHGFYTGSVDGRYGPATELAVRTFQRAAKLSVDGVAGEKTLAALEKQPVSAPSPSAPADDDSLRPGSSGSAVRNLQQLLKKHGFYTGSVDGQYGSGTERAVRNFQQRAGLTADGLAGDKTLSALKNFKSTQSLDWFRNGSSALPKGAVFTVKDVATGKTFRLKRWSGVNHADCEPVTAEDTRILKSIYGGSWSWTRRAILVSYNGRVYAASMNGMPHGDDTISGNNFSGHICLHFTGSKTHGSQKVDSDHQSAVRKALDAVW